MAVMLVKDASGVDTPIEKPLPPGLAAAAASRPVTLSSEDVARTGLIGETAPASDTAASGLNGRLQRIAQRLTSLITQFPVALGANGGMKVDVAADPFGANADVASVNGSLSAKLRALATAVGTTTITRGVGNSDANTLRFVPANDFFNQNGLNTRANSQSVVLADIQAGKYETVAASATAQVLGTTGLTGDYLAGLLVIPATTAAGSVTILDNAVSIPVFIAGTLSNLVPFYVPVGAYSVNGPWKVTTGANVSVFATGNFT